MAEQSPVVSVDTKKKELVGDFKNGGRELRPTASPQEVRVHDFIDPDLGRAVPYGIYDIADNKGWVVLAEPSSAWTWAWITIPRRPRSMRSAAGGARWDRPAIHEPGG